MLMRLLPPSSRGTRWSTSHSGTGCRAAQPVAAVDECAGARGDGAGWPSPRVAAGPARLLRTSIVGDGHVRGLACGDDGKSFKWIAFRSAETELGRALLASTADARWWLAGSIKRDEWNGGNAAEMHVEDAALA